MIQRDDPIRAARIAAGLCVRCRLPPRPSRPGRQVCAECAADVAELFAGRREKRSPGRKLSPLGAAIREALARGGSLEDVVSQTGASRAQVRDVMAKQRRTK